MLFNTHSLRLLIILTITSHNTFSSKGITHTSAGNHSTEYNSPCPTIWQPGAPTTGAHHQSAGTNSNTWSNENSDSRIPRWSATLPQKSPRPTPHGSPAPTQPLVSRPALPCHQAPPTIFEITVHALGGKYLIVLANDCEYRKIVIISCKTPR